MLQQYFESDFTFSRKPLIFLTRWGIFHGWWRCGRLVTSPTMVAILAAILDFTKNFFCFVLFVFLVLIWPCMPGWAHLCGMWAWICLFLAWFGIILSLIWHICELDLAHLWACFGLSCESDLGYQWACFSLFLSLTGHVSSHSGVGSFWACNIIFPFFFARTFCLAPP